MTKRRKSFPDAIVGMHGRFPDSYDVKDFWTNLYEGNDTVRLIPKERWDWEKIFGSSANESESTTINCDAFMPMVDRFDHRFFGIMPREAEAMDPQQRLFIQTAYAALEDAGYAPGSLSGSNTGVFVGIGNADYPMMMRRDGAVFDIYRATGLALTCIANRVSFSLGTHGPSESIDTACSGSLVAIHRAIQAMQYGECDRAIVGGVNLLVGPDLFIAFDKAGMLSKSARSRTFDAAANGYVRGEGVAALVLCPLDVAEKNGDYIYGVIHGSAVNHGGRAHSFTAPNATSQAKVVKTAWENSGKNFHEACMIETHGTGTPLGDPIEVNGLKKVSEEFGFNKKKGRTKSNIALGALKSHVGHMEATAGVGGVIKAILSMKYRVIPKNLNYATLNPHIDLNNTPYYVPTQNVDLNKGKNESTELLAGVSSFGFGGVNSHIVIQSYDAVGQAVDNSVEKQTSDQEAVIPYLIPLSGKDKNSLHSRVQQLIQFLTVSCSELDEDVTYSSVMASLCSSLNIDGDFNTLPSTTLASINASPSKWMKALKELTSLVGRVVDFSEVQDCISLQESARKIARKTQIDNIIRIAKTSDQSSLCSRVALPETEIRTIELDRIAYSLMQGRDNFKERLACIVHSKEELLNLLKAYIEAPDDSHTSLWAHSIRVDDPSIDKPVAQDTHSDAETLAAWAAWWVGTKSATLSWDALYPGAEKPRKFPLPAYPFQLDHIWYKAAQVAAPQNQQLQLLEEKVATQKPLSNIQEPIFLPSGIATAWEACIQQSQLIIPSSVTSLAYLLDYANYKNQSTPVVLENVIFGRPCSMQDEQMVFGYSPGAGSGVIQCLASRADHKVLSQASLMNYPKNSSEVSELGFSSTTLLPTDQFLAQLAKKHLSLGPVLHCMNKIYVSNQKLKIELELPKWKAKDGQFWVPLLASMLSGLAYLNQQQNKPFQLPWKIHSITFNPGPSRAVKALYVEVDPDRNKSSVTVIDEVSNIVLKLEGIVLRGSAIVRLPLRSAETDSLDRLKVGAL
jgi:3-oxoacyl-(acyl-carrier-protein) synthase